MPGLGLARANLQETCYSFFGGMFMSRLLSAMLSIAFLASASSGASAKTCRDAHGKFMKCPAPMMMKHKMCRDKKGHFMKCPMMMHKM